MEKTYKLKKEFRESLPGSGTDFAALLNPQQLAAVTAGDGPMLIIAGAGSGKTRTLTYRVAHLIERGIDPGEILLVTFTNRAAREMVERIEGVLGHRARAVTSGTFHSVALRFVREYATLLGYPSNFRILDSGDAVDLMTQCVAELKIEKRRKKRFPRAKFLISLRSAAVNTGRLLDDILNEKGEQFVDYLEDIYNVLLRYQSRKLEVAAMDFDDLLVNWRRLLVEFEASGAALRARYKHVLVDEYQDTNALQAELVETMASAGNLTVVGDDCQAIYAFRGADYRNILEFADRFDSCPIYPLERNYRSTPQIVALANETIKHNEKQHAKSLSAVRDDGETPGVYRCANSKEESAFVAQRLLELRDEGTELDQIAVLYRSHAHSMELQIELARRDIPFIIRSGVRFFEQQHIKDVLSFLRFLENPLDELSFQRLAMLGDGIGPTTAKRLYLYVQAHPTVDSALRQAELLAIPNARGQHDWKRIVHLLQRLQTLEVAANASTAIDLIHDGFYKRILEDRADRADHRSREIESMAGLANSFGSAREFLDNLTIDTGLSGTDKMSDAEPDESVVLSSIHQSKGLEFDHVFILSAVEERFPSGRASFSQDDIEEERRLFYVACTRARLGLHICQPASGFVAREGLVALRESRFITEVYDADPSLLERWRIG